ncbi:MAG: hypothetical protein ABJD97_03420 [Betaproteobacteria bacterium]
MSAINLYRGLFELLTAPDGSAASAITLETTRAARREVLIVARKEGCLPELYARWEPAGLLSPAESVEHDQFARQRASVADVLRILPSRSLLAGAAGLPCAWGTVDVLLPDFAAIGSLHEAVGRLGYRMEGAGEWLVPLRDPMHRGVASFRYARAALSESAVGIEVQVAGVPIDERRNVPFADLAEHATRLDGLACRALEPTRQLLHCIATFGAQAAPVTVRQIADVHLLLKAHIRRIDHGWLQRQVDQLDVWTGLRQLRDAIVAKRLSALLSWGEFGRMIEISATRADAVATQRARAPRFGTLVRNAFGLLRQPRGDDVVARLARNPWLVTRVLGAGYRVRGLPVLGKPFDAPKFLRVDGALYLATGAGLILLSLVDLSDGAQAELGERVRTGSRPVVLARWTGAKVRAR